MKKINYLMICFLFIAFSTLNFAESFINEENSNNNKMNKTANLLEVIEVAEGTGGIKAAYDSLANGGTIILTTSGGAYHEPEKIGVKNEGAKAFSVVAAEGLEEMPVVTTDGESVFRADQGITLRGIKFNLRFSAGGGSKYLMFTNNPDTTSTLKVEDCVIMDASRGVYVGSKFSVDSVIIRDTKFIKTANQALRLRSKKRPANSILIENCTFDSTGTAIKIETRPDGTAIDDPHTVINHVTVHASGLSGTPSIHIVPKDSLTAVTEVKNSIVVNSDSLALSIKGPNASVHHFMYYNAIGGLDLLGGAASSNIQAEVDPLFVDAANGNFTLSDSSPALGAGQDSKNLGDLNWDVVVGVNDDSSIPKEFNLSQNYPNPFNPSTTIQFSIPKRGSYSLILYNALGEKVTELFNNEINVGNYSIQFNANNLSSGLYFYSLKGENINMTKKMILLK